MKSYIHLFQKRVRDWNDLSLVEQTEVREADANLRAGIGRPEEVAEYRRLRAEYETGRKLDQILENQKKLLGSLL